MAYNKYICMHSVYKMDYRGTSAPKRALPYDAIRSGQFEL